jgi:hypothetical protein
MLNRSICWLCEYITGNSEAHRNKTEVGEESCVELGPSLLMTGKLRGYFGIGSPNSSIHFCSRRRVSYIHTTHHPELVQLAITRRWRPIE